VGNKARLASTVTFYESLVRSRGEAICEDASHLGHIGLELTVVELGKHPRKDLFEATIADGTKVYAWVHHDYLERNSDS
jgi:hypothetical protein